MPDTGTFLRQRQVRISFFAVRGPLLLAGGSKIPNRDSLNTLDLTSDCRAPNRLAWLHEQLVMVGHQHKGMQVQAKGLRPLRKQTQEMLTIPVIAKDDPPLDAAGAAKDSEVLICKFVPAAGIDASSDGTRLLE